MNTKWLTTKQLGFYHGGLAAVNYFNERIGERRGDYPCLTNKHDKLISEINTNGYAKLEGVFTKRQIEALGQDFDTAQASGLVSQDNEFFTMIQDPLYASKTAFEIATSDLVYEIATEFFQCVPSLCTQNFRLSKLTNNPATTTQLYHADRNSIKFMKFFIYLNDVDEHGGPLTFVEGSNANKFYDHLSKYRWSDEEVKAYYGEDKIKKLTAKSGDLLIALTTGFHKGLKPEKADRRMLTLNYVVHMESDVSRLFKTRKKWVENLPDYKKPLFDFMEVV